MGVQVSFRKFLFAFVIWGSFVSSVLADVSVQRIEIDNAPPVIVIKGDFAYSDDPEALAREVAATGAKVVTFDSNGGNIVKAMAFGRKIRELGLSTFQLRASQCASACALAFVGGKIRQADPGSIGVHRSSFSPESNLDGHTAVAAVQEITAQIMTYFIEMGVDPRLLQLSLSVASDDMRYLTASEMLAYHVTVDEPKDVPPVDPALVANPSMPKPADRRLQPPSDERKALAFVARYHDAWSLGNADALAFMETAYAETVEFYGKPTAKNVVISDKRKFAERWPLRAYSVRPGSERVTCRAMCEAEGLIEWFAESASGDRKSSGLAEFSLTWDPSQAKILSEFGKVVMTDKAVSEPARLLDQWRNLNTQCRGGSGDSDATVAVCERRDILSTKLKAVGWCYGRDGEYGYQMEWHSCGQPQAAGSTGSSSGIATLSKRPDPVAFKVRETFSGKTRLPDFRGRDREFNSLRTRIRNGLREGPNFAGHYSLIQIGCGSGCSFVVVADNKTGEPRNFPLGGESNMYLQLDYRRDSRLLSVQWADYDTDRCYAEFFDFVGDTWKALGKQEIGKLDACYREIKENLR